MELFQPKRIFFEPEALDYPLGIKLHTYFTTRGDSIQWIGSHNRVLGIPGKTPQQAYCEGKQTLVVGVKRNLHLDTCKPSADFEFSLSTGCPGQCQYCYLQTHLGKKPYIRVYVNLEQIFAKITAITNERLPRITTFEAASTSDPIAVEHLTGSLGQAIRFFGQSTHAKLRIVTKFTNVEPLLSLPHNHQTKIRFSLNTEEIIRRFENRTTTLSERIAAANLIAEAGYPLGFIIAPLFIYPGYQDDYTSMFQQLASSLTAFPDDLSFELITHRFTASAKKIILERFPRTGLDLDETRRQRKWGRYGIVKYIYPSNDYQILQKTVVNLIERYFPASRIEYFT